MNNSCGQLLEKGFLIMIFDGKKKTFTLVVSGEVCLALVVSGEVCLTLVVSRSRVPLH